MSVSPDSFVAGHHGSEPMTMGTPTSPTSPGHTSQYLPSYLLGDSMTHSVSPVSSRLWSGSGGSPPRSSHRASSLTSPNISGFQHGTPRLETSMRGKDKAGAPPIRSLLQSTSPAHAGASSPFATPTQYPTRTPGLSTPAPPTTGLSHSLHETMYATPEQSGLNTSRIPTSPAQLDPFYTQGESLTTDDVLDETWITVFGFPPPAASYVLQQFSQYGNILKHVLPSQALRVKICILSSKVTNPEVLSVIICILTSEVTIPSTEVQDIYMNSEVTIPRTEGQKMYIVFKCY
ncbi:nucleoporin NUP35-like isoform X2 [Mercenaria mercenaria]|uniref:nucleoporin NUP35-like isoform X2 n=1 Tax=Mercenaria mercenaria TaxID=6596 RepID=UPI00234EAEE3|nr:nucleoporin NUP35-like isoform X2 [Mercenaria mercenaria]